MKCVKCNNKTETKDSRLQNDNTIRRRRVCRVCGFTMRTTESVSNAPTFTMTKPVYTKPQKKVLKRREKTVDFNAMTDEELEAWIYNDNEI